ncbi:D-alanyl-D-alanine endopeptidase [Dechloromonas denitrificans]|uniref:D-alanyl-D-alanine endopeptidase n=1 Tax=Dechloromonas denitrificans TaxID=281362 RepID=UPI001CF8753F|nr:D-alanyl-D-alanine endopeptidase [Dechloromonas denitrificans]UCV04661.1 D-alanyl-D-alanine endopeptidase [Dechloromonas denitrificans]UCV09029.1 D-alanyl-D-alanine endopeptidase [Dechloromonas denitrificans]
MKQKIKVALLVSALLSAGLGGPSQAVAAKKTEQQTSKKAVGKTVGKSSPKKTAAAPSKSLGKSTQVKTSGKSLHVGPNERKSVRRVSMVDIDPGRLALYSASALVIDQNTGQALLEKQSDAVLPIASISKLMTAMVVLDAKLDLHDLITIGSEDVDGLKGTRSRLPVGTTMTRETAMLLALMSSENRAANALGRHYPGGLPAFVHAMNKKAQSLGMYNSRFEEPTGLSSNNVSTAHDLARMVAAAARYPEIRAASTTAEAKVELNGRITDFHNTNALVRSDNWEIGVSKTGYISEAGRCLVMQARVADKPVVIVLLDSVGKMTRVGDANRIKRWMESASLSQERRPA